MNKYVIYTKDYRYENGVHYVNLYDNVFVNLAFHNSKTPKRDYR